MNNVIGLNANEWSRLQVQCTEKDLFIVNGDVPNYFLVEDLLKELAGGNWKGFGACVRVLRNAGYDVNRDNVTVNPSQIVDAYNRIRLSIIRVVKAGLLNRPTLFERLFLFQSNEKRRENALEEIYAMSSI